ncbi:MAG: hypothetical protein KY452_02440 [Actinobacteria bacterium]|nr:hypothetical protein [Actinomycetota bacterium]
MTDPAGRGNAGATAGALAEADPPLAGVGLRPSELGNNICTAFDEGQSVDQVKATGAQLVKKVPFATLLPGGDDYIIRTGVALYCPGHAPKLG